MTDQTETFEQRLREIVSKIELGMNCHVRIGYSAERDEHFVQIQCWRMDVITKKEGWGFGGKGWPSPHSTRNEIVQMIFGLYKGYWEHEARENFTYRGRRVYGPHMDVDAIWEVANRVDVRSLKHVEDQDPALTPEERHAKVKKLGEMLNPYGDYRNDPTLENPDDGDGGM